jgi:hypothetical protein
MKSVLKQFPLGFLVCISLLLAACRTTGPGAGLGAPAPGTGSGATPQNIGGTVFGLAGTGMVLQDNLTDDLTISANGPFTFHSAVGGAYAVTVKTQPTSPVQTCSVTNGTGTTAGAAVSNVQIVCGNVFTVGGTITGLLGTGLVLQDNGGDNFKVSGSGNLTFTFATPLTSGRTYAVTVLTQPSGPIQTCSVSNGTGTVNGNISNVQVACSQPSYTVGGSVVGLVTGAGDTLELQNNAGDDLFVTGDTSFTFATPVTNGGIYNVSVFIPPTSQPQRCNLFNATGSAVGNVSNVLVDCQHNDWNWVSWYVPATNKSNNYATVTTPLFPVNALPPPNLSTPGGRDFGVTWTDPQGRKWLFGGLGYPYPSPLGNQPSGLLNDLWVFDGSWIPANLPTFFNTAGDCLVNVVPLEATNASGVYGTLNTSSGGSPGSRWGGSTWTDASGNLWMFGGQGYDATGLSTVLLNDLWEWVPGAANACGTFTGQWIWRGGLNTGTQAARNGAYGTKGTASAANLPGGRWAAATFTDSVGGNVWLFGGQGVDSASTTGLLGDLWKYNIASGQWTWVAGSNLASPNGVYGTLGTAAATNAPGGRETGVLWVDSSGNVWLYGGFGLDSVGNGGPAGAILNDLWKFDGANWTWVSGNNVANQTGVYGTQTAAAATNFPGSRWGAVGWTDASNNLWIYGGWGYGSATTNPTGFLNDVWEYQNSSKQWIWWKGSSDVNQNGSYLTNGIPYVNNVAGARRGAALWQPDANHYVWIFGGEGDDSGAGPSPGYLDDLWTYLPFP